MPKVHILRVFTDEHGRGGNPLGVVVDESGETEGRRQAIATALGYSETVFIEDVAAARLRIFTPATELPLAGHPLVGAAWFLRELTGAAVDVLRPVLAGEVATWLEGDVHWIRALVADAPSWQLVQLADPREIDALSAPPGPEYDRHELWAWQDEARGVLRARVFATAWGIREDEATGSAALVLTTHLNRAITINQGQGSVLYARPASAGRAEVGGRVAQDKTRELPAP